MADGETEHVIRGSSKRTILKSSTVVAVLICIIVSSVYFMHGRQVGYSGKFDAKTASRQSMPYPSRLQHIRPAGGIRRYPAEGVMKHSAESFRANLDGGLGGYPTNRFEGNPADSFRAYQDGGLRANPANGFRANPAVDLRANLANGFRANPAVDLRADPANGYRANPLGGFKANPADGFRANPADRSRANPANGFRADPASVLRSNPKEDLKGNPAEGFRGDPAEDYGGGQAPIRPYRMPNKGQFFNRMLNPNSRRNGFNGRTSGFDYYNDYERPIRRRPVYDYYDDYTEWNDNRHLPKYGGYRGNGENEDTGRDNEGTERPVQGEAAYGMKEDATPSPFDEFYDTDDDYEEEEYDDAINGAGVGVGDKGEDTPAVYRDEDTLQKNGLYKAIEQAQKDVNPGLNDDENNGTELIKPVKEETDPQRQVGYVDLSNSMKKTQMTTTSSADNDAKTKESYLKNAMAKTENDKTDNRENEISAQENTDNELSTPIEIEKYEYNRHPPRVPYGAVNPYKWDTTAKEPDNVRCVPVQTMFSKYDVCTSHADIDPDSSGILENKGMWKSVMIKDVQLSVLGGKDIALIDVGAGIGVFTLPTAKLGREVIAVEAYPTSIQRLQQSVMKNNVSHLVTLFRNIVSNYPKRMLINIEDDHIKYEPAPEWGESVNADVVTSITLNDLSMFIPSSVTKAVLKIDKQGFIGHALEQSDQLFDRVDIVVVIVGWNVEDTNLCEFIVDVLHDKGYIPYSRFIGTSLSLESAKKWPGNYLLWKKT